MNAPFPQPAIAASGERDDPAWAAHLFRSKLIDKLAAVERWMAEFLELAPPACPKTKAASQPYLLGQKLAKVRELTQSQSALFKSPTKVAELLDQLHPFAVLRSTLAHATLKHELLNDGSLLFTFEPACANRCSRLTKRVSLHNRELDELRRELNDLSNRLCQQKQADA